METGGILIVDDDANSREVLRATLTPLGHNIHMAEDGFEALQIASTVQPDLIFLDIMMPGMTGIEVCRKLRADSNTARVPIIIVTALDDRSTRLEGLDAGGDEFITKPVDITEVRLRAKTILALNRYRALNEQKEKLALTMAGSLKLLNELLVIKHPKAFSLTNEKRALSRKIGRKLNITELQNLELATLLCQAGRLTIPDETLHRFDNNVELTPAEQHMMERLPEASRELLENIPGLETIAHIVWWQEKNFDGTGFPVSEAGGDNIPMASRILRVVRDFYREHLFGASPQMAFRRLKAHSSFYDPQVLSALQDFVDEPSPEEDLIEKMVKVVDLRPGMVTQTDVRSVANPRVLVKSGVVLTRSLVARIGNIAKLDGVTQPIRVGVPKQSQG